VKAAATDRLILFVGGGVSQSLGLPDFRALVRHLADDLGFPSESLTTDEYAVIAEAYLLKHGKLGPLRAWMDSTWHLINIDISKSELHNLIVDLGVSIVYPTNYDR
jgi:NAD-dependent SIR2 family protein deacetylase